jgi:hypothetical protein
VLVPRSLLWLSFGVGNCVCSQPVAGLSRARFGKTLCLGHTLSTLAVIVGDGCSLVANLLTPLRYYVLLSLRFRSLSSLSGASLVPTSPGFGIRSAYSRVCRALDEWFFLLGIGFAAVDQLRVQSLGMA